MESNVIKLPSLLFRWRLAVAIVLGLLLLFLQSCSKTGSAPATDDLLKQYFETNVLNRDFIVSQATDTATDKTAQFSGYTFRLLKNTYFDGPMTAIKNGATISGTWSSNEDFSKLTINLTQPATPAAFLFINRAWRFTRKAFPVMELAPWGTTDPKVLHMQRL